MDGNVCDLAATLGFASVYTMRPALALILRRSLWQLLKLSAKVDRVQKKKNI